MDLDDADATGEPGRLVVTWTEPDGVADQQLRIRDPIGREIERRRIEPQGSGTEHEETIERLEGPAEYTAIITAVDADGDSESVHRHAEVTEAGPVADNLRLEFEAPYVQSEGSIEGNARLTETQPASVVIVRDAEGQEIGVAYPDSDGDYTANADGPITIEAHAFDPQYWRGIWQSETEYQRGDVVVPTDPEQESPLLEAVTSGESGTSEPDWPTRGTVEDGEIIWASLGPIQDAAPVVNLYDAS